MSAIVAVRADVNDESPRRDVDLVRTEKKQNIERLRLGHAQGRAPALTRRETNVERTDTRRGGVQHRKSVPSVFHHAERGGSICGKRGHARAVDARQCMLAE